MFVDYTECCLAVDDSAHVGHIFMTVIEEREGLCYITIDTASSTIEILKVKTSKIIYNTVIMPPPVRRIAEGH